MKKFFAVFGAFVGVVSALVTIYVAAVQFHVLWAFWLVLVVGIPLAVLLAWGRKLSEWLMRIRNYDAVLARMVAAEAAAEAAPESLRIQWEAGVLSGRSDVFGAIAATAFNGELTPSEALTTDEGRVVIAAPLASSRVPPLGARFILKTVSLGEEKGLVQVIEYSPDRQFAILERVESRDGDAFWTSMRERAKLTPHPLPGFVMVPLSFNALFEAHKATQKIESQEGSDSA